MSQELLKESLEELNAEKRADFKKSAKTKIQAIADTQKKIKDLEKQLETLKAELKALTLEVHETSVLS